MLLQTHHMKHCYFLHAVTDISVSKKEWNSQWPCVEVKLISCFMLRTMCGFIKINLSQFQNTMLQPYNLYSSLSIRMNSWRMLRWMELVACMEDTKKHTKFWSWILKGLDYVSALSKQLTIYFHVSEELCTETAVTSATQNGEWSVTFYTILLHWKKYNAKTWQHLTNLLYMESCFPTWTSSGMDGRGSKKIIVIKKCKPTSGSMLTHDT